MPLGRLTLVLTTLVALGCYSPDLGEGELACGPNGDCPPGYHCTAGRCYQGTVLVDSIAGTVDSRPADASIPIDAPVTDPCMLAQEGSACGEGDACHAAPTCVGGVCTAHPLDDGSVCAPTFDPCRRAGTCSGGVCGAITNQSDGIPCTTPADPCVEPGTCSGGACGAETVKPTGAIQRGGGYFDRCCDGAEVRIDTSSSNCGACGLSCPSGQDCIHHSDWPEDMYLCACTTSASCWSGCCTNHDLICAASDICASGDHCIPCPGNAICTESDIHFYCHY